MTPFGDDIWLDTAPIGFLGLRLTVNMAVIRLGDGTLLVWSPLELTPERRAAVEAFGPVAHLYSPNLFHHLHLGDWADAWPEATVHAHADLPQKRPDVHLDRAHGAALPAALADCLDEVPIDGFRIGDAALVHRPSATAFVGDLVSNVGRPEHGWTAVYTKAMGFYDRVALSRVIRWTAFADRKAARASVDALLARPFDRLVFGHGAPLTADARAILGAAVDFLPAIDPASG